MLLPPPLILSLFPGIDLLGRALEEQGFTGRGRALNFHNRPGYASVIAVFSPGHVPGRPATLSTLVAPRNGKGKTWG